MATTFSGACANIQNLICTVSDFKYLGSVLTRYGYCKMEIKMRIIMAKQAFKIKISLSTSKLNTELRKKLEALV